MHILAFESFDFLPNLLVLRRVQQSPISIFEIGCEIKNLAPLRREPEVQVGLSEVLSHMGVREVKGSKLDVCTLLQGRVAGREDEALDIGGVLHPELAASGADLDVFALANEDWPTDRPEENLAVFA